MTDQKLIDFINTEVPEQVTVTGIGIVRRVYITETTDTDGTGVKKELLAVGNLSDEGRREIIPVFRKGVLGKIMDMILGVRTELKITPSVLKQESMFNWGYVGYNPKLLSRAILSYFIPDVSGDLVDLFTYVFVANLPQTDFNVDVQMRELLLSMLGVSDTPVELKELVVEKPCEYASVIPGYTYVPGAVGLLMSKLGGDA